jgi:ElaB/YqjD/DUF883 family membrane-anchored ribosome-binding protein
MDTSSNPPFGSQRTSSSNGPSSASEARQDVSAAIERGKANLTESASAAATDLGEDLRKLRADVASIQDTLSKHGVEIGTEASRVVKDVGSTLASTAKGQAKTLASDLEEMARKNPLGTLAGTLLVGMVIGLMSRSRS